MEELQFESLDLDAMVSGARRRGTIPRRGPRDSALPRCASAGLARRDLQSTRGDLRTPRENMHPAQRSERHLSRGLRLLLAVTHLARRYTRLQNAKHRGTRRGRHYREAKRRAPLLHGGSMRGPTERDVQHLARACETIRERFPDLELCLSIGLLGLEQAARSRRPARA